MSGNVWDKQDYETPKAHQGFLAYRDLGPKRSLKRAWTLYQERTKPEHKRNNNVSSHFADWSRNNQWVERAEAWDLHQASLVEQQREDQRRRLIESEIDDYETQLAKWHELWQRTKLHERRTQRILEDGTIVELIEVNISDFSRLAKLREDISRQGRRALGLPEKITESMVQGQMDVNFREVDPETLSDDDLAQIIGEVDS